MTMHKDRHSAPAGRILRAAVLFLAFALGGCVTKTASISTEPNPDEVFPRALVDLAEPYAKTVGLAVEKVEFRSGYLYKNQPFLRHITRRFEPLDIVAVSNKGALASRLIPGYFTHSAAYIGTEAELRRLGVWNNKHVRPHHAEIRAGKTMIESTNDGVHLSTPEVAFNTDRVVVARPGGSGGLPLSRKRAAIIELFRLIGTEFDFHFDSGETETLFCIELIQQAVPDIKLERKVIYGRQTIKPVAVARGVFEPRSNLAFMGYYEGRPSQKWVIHSRADLKHHLNRADAEALRWARYLSPVPDPS